jgi:hypothetical protein
MCACESVPATSINTIVISTNILSMYLMLNCVTAGHSYYEQFRLFELGGACAMTCIRASSESFYSYTLCTYIGNTETRFEW